MPAMKGSLPEDFKQIVLDRVRTMLDDPTCQVGFSRGMHGHPDDDGQFMVYEPTQGQTLTIDIHGGAIETEESIGEWALKKEAAWRSSRK